MAVVNTGMSKGEMKKLLNRSKEEPVHVAVGMGENPAMGLLMIHKQKKDRALEGLLKADFPDARNTRWGTAFVDVDDNPTLVKFVLNKPVSGMARKLIKTLKGTGFSKVIILTEDGSLMDSFEEEDEDAAATDVAGAAPATAAPPPPASPPPAAQATPEQKAARTATLAKALAALVPGIAAAAGGDPARKAVLDKLARDAAVNIKTGNLEYGANFVEQLRTALGAAPPPPPAPPPPAAQATPKQKAARTAALATALAALVPGIAAAAGNDPARKAVLDKLARDAAVNIKTGNLEYGANFVAQLKTALDGGSPSEGGAAKPGGSRVEFARLRLAWDDARKHLAGQLGTLKSAIVEQSADEEDAADIKANAGAVEEALSHFDDDLSDALDDLYNAGGADAGLQRAARALALSYRAFLESDPLMQDLDGNPFVPLDARKQLDGTLNSIIARL